MGNGITERGTNEELYFKFEQLIPLARCDFWENWSKYLNFIEIICNH